jgi:hypothetical protein
MKKLLIILCFCPLFSNAQKNEKNLIDTIDVGFYVDDIYDINYVKGTYRINLFLWATSSSVKYDFTKFLDIHQAIDKNIELVMLDSSNQINGRKVYWSEAKLNLEVLQKFDITKFPFDKQNINLKLEFTYDDIDSLKVNLSYKNSIIPKSIPFDWKIDSKGFVLKPYHYDTNFGDVSVKSYNFNVLGINYSFIRESTTLFVKLFIALFISLLIACSSLFLPNVRTESKITLIIGGLYGAIANKYITDSFLPINNTWDLSDKIHSLTIFYLLILSLYSIYEQRKGLIDNFKKDLIFFFSLIVSYTLLIVSFILKL